MASHLSYSTRAGGRAGDWCLGARVECAYASGTAIAEAVLGQWLA